ncbi:MAG: hypothetical protein MUO72_20565 [Bacteroidales bacterium]|nr:hypothetical protein [Bacteroidales bacterium]
METTDWIQFGLLLLTIIGLLISINFNRKQLKLFNEQLRLNFFAEYTKRYQEIILNLPEEISKSDFSYTKLSDEVRSKTLRYIRAYFDLCSEEYDLWNAGYLDKRIWNYWREGIEYTFSKTAFKDAWGMISLDTKYYPQFTILITDLLNKDAASPVE